MTLLRGIDSTNQHHSHTGSESDLKECVRPHSNERPPPARVEKLSGQIPAVKEQNMVIKRFSPSPDPIEIVEVVMLDPKLF